MIINQPDGTQVTRPLTQVLQDPRIIQVAQFTPVTATDKDGVKREITGTYLDRSKIFIQPNAAGLPTLDFGMNDEGAKLLGQATTRFSNPPQPMAFFLDGEPIKGADGRIVAPLVQSSDP